MVHRLLRRLGFALFGSLVGYCSLVMADQPGQSGQDLSPSVQQQLDELKAGQDKLFKELQEIKLLLGQRDILTNITAKTALPSISSVNVRGEPVKGANTAAVRI